MTHSESVPLPSDERERLSAIPAFVTCPNGHEVNTGYSLWEMSILGEKPRQTLKLQCPGCQVNFTINPKSILISS